MAAFLVDESCPRAVVEALVGVGHDVRYAADSDRRAADVELVSIALAEHRVIVTEDFDFGELLIRNRLRAPGAIILFLPESRPAQRASRLLQVLTSGKLTFEGKVTILTARQVRQRPLPE
jgi:predicted nuclease of predicted toxin-antitoxin system